MIIEYSIEPIAEVAFKKTSEMYKHVKFEDADIYFDVYENHLYKLRLRISGLQMKWEREDLIDPNYPETSGKAFRIMKYLVDRIQLQVKNKPFVLKSLDDIKTTVYPETEKEKDNWCKFRKLVCASFKSTNSFLGAVDTSDYESKYKYSQAYSNFTDALNTDNPIIRFENLYKVIETFFKTKGPDLDSEVSTFMQDFDAEFMSDDFACLRTFRNRCMHPLHKKGHVSSNNLLQLDKLDHYNKILERIAELLLKEK